jgi:hypothetical protein
MTTLCRRVFLQPGIFAGLLAAAAPACAQAALGVTDFGGSWTVRWLSSDSRNPIVLQQDGTSFKGSYTNDTRDRCAVSGTFATELHRIALRISCPQGDIQVTGVPSLDGKFIAGRGFMMSRE